MTLSKRAVDWNRRGQPPPSPGIDGGAPPTSDDQPPQPLSPSPSSPPLPTTLCTPTLLMCCTVIRRPLALLCPPPPSRRVVRLQLTSLCPLRPHSSRRVVRCPPTTWQHRHCLIAASSSSPLPLSPSRPLAALACRQRNDIAATIVATSSSSPTNKGVHPREESHGVCHGRGASSGSRNIVGITPPPRRCRRRAATAAGDPREGGGERRPGKPSS